MIKPHLGGNIYSLYWYKTINIIILYLIYCSIMSHNCDLGFRSNNNINYIWKFIRTTMKRLSNQWASYSYLETLIPKKIGEERFSESQTTVAATI